MGRPIFFSLWEASGNDVNLQKKEKDWGMDGWSWRVWAYSEIQAPRMVMWAVKFIASWLHVGQTLQSCASFVLLVWLGILTCDILPRLKSGWPKPLAVCSRQNPADTSVFQQSFSVTFELYGKHSSAWNGCSCIGMYLLYLYTNQL